MVSEYLEPAPLLFAHSLLCDYTLPGQFEPSGILGSTLFQLSYPASTQSAGSHPPGYFDYSAAARLSEPSFFDPCEIVTTGRSLSPDVPSTQTNAQVQPYPFKAKPMHLLRPSPLMLSSIST